MLEHRLAARAAVRRDDDPTFTQVILHAPDALGAAPLVEARHTQGLSDEPNNPDDVSSAGEDFGESRYHLTVRRMDFMDYGLLCGFCFNYGLRFSL